VEDQEENGLLLQELLEGVGFSVRVAQDGAAGVAEFQAWQPAFIWMDWRLPVLDGREATQRIRALPGGRAVKIVALTASAFQDEKDQILASGVDDFLQKPYRFEEIFACLERHLGVRYLRSGPVDPSDPRPLSRSREALALLPETLQREFEEALLRLDADRVGQALDQIAGLNPVLAEALHPYVHRFQYTPLLQLLQRAAP
jgi:CheY-like chemotaxis protein